MSRSRVRPRRGRRRAELDHRWSCSRALTAVALATLVSVLMPAAALSTDTSEAHRGIAQSSLPWLSAKDGRITDDTGHTILLRGFNVDALLDYAGEPPAPIDATDAALMESSGFNAVRLPIAWSRLEPARGSFDTGYLDLIDRAVTMLNRHRLYVILDMHFLDWGARYGGSGAPPWAHVDHVPDLRVWHEPWGRHLSPAQNADYTHFWTSDDWQQDFLQTWRLVAGHFTDRSGVAGYDMFNEPHPLPIPPGAFERRVLWPLYAKTASSIAAADANHLVIAEATLFADLGTATVELRAPNLVYSGHVYTGSLVPPPFTGDPRALRNHIDGQRVAAAQLGVPLWEGEFGIDHTQAHAADWADAALDHFDDLNVGWSWWQWRQDLRWGMRDRTGQHVDEAFLGHVARPYLLSASMSVRAGHGDSVRRRIAVHVGGMLDDPVTVAWPQNFDAATVRTDCAAVHPSPDGPGRVRLAVHATSACDITVSAAITQSQGG